jgi:2-oxoisovalerate dehydrogenase E1 component
VDWKEVCRFVLLSRTLDDLEITQLTPQGKVKYQFSAGGHELAQVLLARSLNHPHDAAAVYYRSRPFALAAGLTIEEALTGSLARANSPSEGRDTGVIFNLPARGALTILPASGNVGAQYTPAVGWAQAIHYRQTVMNEADWQGAIAVATGGEGSVAANGFWAALNIAATQKLPLLFVIEDNSYGLSVPSTFQTPTGNIASNLACYQNLRVMEADGTHPENAFENINQAIEHVRSGAGPCLLRNKVVRLTGHTFIDDQSYKSPQEREQERSQDPLTQLKEFMLTGKMSLDEWIALEKQVQDEIMAALEIAESTPEPDPTEATRYLFFEGKPPIQGGLRAEGALIHPGSDRPQSSGPRINFVDAVRRALEDEMQQNPRMMVFGEDVGVKGGVHGATLDMQNHFGAARVFDTSLNEDGIIGRSAGLAYAGLLPVPEIQFRKYADPAHEQISDLGTVRWRTANRFAAPVVVRIPVGFGKKTGDPWHSVTGEAVFAHLPGWRIAFPSNAADAVGLLRSALRGDDPTFFFEHRALLDTPEGRRPYPGSDYCLPFGRAAHLTEGSALTVITWGAMTQRCLAAARPFDGEVEILDLRTIIPWDQEAVLESVQKTGKVLIVHEDTITTGFGAEIAAIIASQAFTSLDAPIERLAVPDIPVPYNIRMMEAILPSTSTIQKKIAWLLNY